MRTVREVCPACKRAIDLRRALPIEGWQTAHTCHDWTVEVLVLEADGKPSLWAARRSKSAESGA
ncbi:MAG TPA: hypothetical protein VFY71_11850 [Planctomycetota bacterium]|nr:hypothetical protein [Planctomycetota bacterium]